MIRLSVATAIALAWAPASAQVQAPVQINPFVTVQTAPAATGPDLFPAPEGKGARQRPSGAAPAPIPVAALGYADTGIGQDLKSAMDGAVLIGRTRTHAILGFPIVAPLHTSGQTKHLRNVTVRNGGFFYIGARRLKVELDDDQPGARVLMDGAVLFTLEVESQRTVATPAVQSEQASAGGSGVGQAASPGAGANAPSAGQRPLQQGNSQPGQLPNGAQPLTR
jgi:hypothetical protein